MGGGEERMGGGEVGRRGWEVGRRGWEVGRRGWEEQDVNRCTELKENVNLSFFIKGHALHGTGEEGRPTS